MNYALLMPGAGSGSRLGAAIPKALIELTGKPLFCHAAAPFLRDAHCKSVVIAAPPGYEREFESATARWLESARIRVVTGGAVRQDSVRAALRAVTAPVDAVLVHDAARPLISPELIQRIFSAFSEDYAAVVPGVPVTDTLKRVAGSPPSVVKTVDRVGLIAAQTPQALRYSLALRAYELAAEARFEGTDDVSLIEHLNLGAVLVVEGDPRNFKITTQEDLARARELLERDAEIHGSVQ